MAAIDPKYLTCTGFLYPSIEAGAQGINAGGTAFFVAFSAPDGSASYYPYVVTNKHVIDAGCRFLRIGMKDGSSLTDEVLPEAWTFAPDDDLALAPIGLPDGHDIVPFDIDLFLPESGDLEGWSIFPGDDVLFYGRFVGHDGHQKNRPVIRFGNIAMLPDANAPIDFGSHQQLAYLVECRSLSGFSGAPAFVGLAQPRPVFPHSYARVVANPTQTTIQ